MAAESHHVTLALEADGAGLLRVDVVGEALLDVEVL
jgi:hypothetical protein